MLMPHRPHNFRARSKPKPIHKSQHHHYWPYIPLLVLIFGIFLVNIVQPLQKRGVLAYATNTSIDGLLSTTNQQRTQNGASDLQLNQNLSSAAQAKANDMIARNYWSHNTPEGQEPWIFINDTGYKYQKAGENLAYGFGTSDDTVTGWMNSPTHRENLLDNQFSDVGFGFANGQNFNNSGPETVVVAMYGKPQVLAASNQVSQEATPTPEPSPAPLVNQTKPSTNQATESQKSTATLSVKPVTTDAPIYSEPATQHVARIQTLTRGKAPWTLFAVGLLSGLSVMFLLMRHAVGLRHLLKNGERFILHHPLLDTILVSLILLGSFMSKTTGLIR